MPCLSAFFFPGALEVSGPPSRERPSTARAAVSHRLRSWCAAARGLWRRRRGAGPEVTTPAPLEAQGSALSPHELLRDVQDGLGARLSRLAGAAGHAGRPEGALGRDLEASRFEMRVLGHAAQRSMLTLDEPLGWLHEQVQQALCDRGLVLHWQVDERVAQLALPVRDTLALLWIAREALDNVVLHAHGAVSARFGLELTCGETGCHLRLSVEDDGRPNAVIGSVARFHPGRGLARVQRQATALGAQLVVGPEAQGWTLEIGLPLEPADRCQVQARGGSVA
ncbi:hypothetical protein [Sphaerotilus hippei]|nr:hypothetical protein [Sphaerotilus hippei]